MRPPSCRRLSLQLPSLLSRHVQLIRSKPLLSCSTARLYSPPRMDPTSLARSTPPRTPVPKSKVLVLGAGNFGSCLADHLGDSEHEVLLWSRSKDLVDHFDKCHKNNQYLTDHIFPDSITAVGPDLPSADVLRSLDVVLFALPTQALRYILTLV